MSEKKLYEYFRHEWIFQERIGGKDNMYIPLYACVHLFIYVCVLHVCFVMHIHGSFP